MKHQTRFGSLLISTFVTACLLVAGCGIEEYYTNMGDGALPGDPLNPEVPTVTCDNATCECECGGGTVTPTCADPALDDMTGKAYRFDSIELGEPLVAAGVADMVNSMFLEDKVDSEELNVLLVVRTDDRDTGQLVMDIGAGEVSGDGYAFFDGSASETIGQICGTEIQTVERADLILPLDPLDPPELPLRNLAISGVVTGSGITDGEMVGVLLKSDADATTVLSQSFSEFLADVPLDVDTDDDGTMDAWTFEGTFTAVEATVQ